MKKIKNVEYASYDYYLDDLIKSLSNFCNKSPLKPKIKIVKEMGLIYIYYNDQELEISIDVNKNKKDVIGYVKSILEKHYPIIYKKSNIVPNADDVRKLLNKGKTLEEALNSTKINYEPLYRVERIHDSYNELDLLSLDDNEIYKFKAKIPLVVILEDLKYKGEDSEVLDKITMLYKISKKI